MAGPHTGRPGSTPIHPDFAAAHRKVAEAEHTAACTIRRPGGTPGPLDTATGRRPQLPNSPHYTGACSATYLRAETIPQGGEETLSTVRVEVAIAVDAAPLLAVDDLITITDPGPHGDASLADLHLVVDTITRDTIALETVLTCRETQNQT